MNNRVAIIHDWLTGMRGGERVLENMLDIFPDADIFTLFLEPDKISEKIRAHRIIPSALNRSKFIRNRYQYFLPFFPVTVENFDLRNYDLIISSSHCVAKGVVSHPGSLHIGYIFSPMRYVWDQYHAYFGNARGLRNSVVRRQVSRLRVWDVVSSNRVDHFVTISNFVRQRIWKYYRREADVIYPPVETDFFRPADKPDGDFFLTVSALVPYKKIDLLIDAFNRLPERLIIVGSGSEEKKLKKRAGKHIEFRKNLSSEELKALYQHARAFVFAGIEDFGISFVEAQACGIPIIAYRRGGVLDIVRDGETGILYDHQNAEEIIRAIDGFRERELDRDRKFNPGKIRQNSLRFAANNFKQSFSDYVRGKQ
jgi:glycosyltransferase involved in cell wall biosynthesis